MGRVPHDQRQIQRTSGVHKIERLHRAAERPSARQTPDETKLTNVEKKNYIVAIDLGSSNVVVAVAERDAEGRPVVRSIVSKPSQGVKAGMITNIEQVSNSIKAAVETVGEELGIRITEAYTGISGDFVRCARHTDHVFTSDPQNGVNRTDVEALFDRMRNVQAPDDETIMERIPQNYLVDENQEVADPVGSFGKRLASTFNFILCAKTPIERLNLALRRLGIRSLGMYANALVTGAAVLSADEKEEGAAVVNIGGGVTDVAVYYRNVPRYIATIPMGGGGDQQRHPHAGHPRTPRGQPQTQIRFGGRRAGARKQDGKRQGTHRQGDQGYPAAQPGRGDRIARPRYRRIRRAGDPGFEIRRQTGLRHRADGRFGQIEGPRRTVPPRDGHGRACRCARDGNHRGVEGEGCGRRFLDRRGHPAQGPNWAAAPSSSTPRLLVPSRTGLSRRRSPQRAGSRLRSRVLPSPIRLPCRLRNPIPGCRPEPKRPDGRTKSVPTSRR